MSFYSILKPTLFALDPERAHDLTIGSLKAIGKCIGASEPKKGRSVEVAGLRFENPIGLAAGLDKDGVAIAGLSRLGFGHIEVGTVTPRPQPGNAKPRIFRLEKDLALINRFGFNNQGINALVSQLSGHPYNGIIGVNIGKNKDTPNERAQDDYVICVKHVAAVTDYITVNLSSPNTPGLRDLGSSNMILDIISPVLQASSGLKNRGGKQLPIFVKLAPDFEDAELIKVLETLKQTAADGIILTNTTINRDHLTDRHCTKAGGLSGAPLARRSEHCLDVAINCLEGQLPVISVGGVMTAEDAKRRIDLGASLVQIYTGLIYRGPELVSDAIKVTR